MGILEDIESLQDRVDDLLNDVPISQQQINEAAVQAILKLLDERDLRSLSPARLDEAIRQALRPASTQLTSYPAARHTARPDARQRNPRLLRGRRRHRPRSPQRRRPQKRGNAACNRGAGKRNADRQ